ncbi:M14 family metallopeptidase [Algoriphagus hitonicola]|uniref:Zinc carboxypeptidase n=1 Tax=Algoriphagus hitonicola TaxID=435880 RepID=A0A1I2QEW5_9BACT|nr:M14 family metallopeptidase [Algoriphagus hitonicola]SFG26173.1 Zinc carboxypeptidase [Algoriphagus hitonicola]
MKKILLLCFAFYSFQTIAQDFMPPLIDWSGKSESLQVAENHPWVTPSELDDLTTSPDYEETVNWLRKLTDSSPLVEMKSLGKSEQGRDIWMLIASDDSNFDPAKIREQDKAVLLFHGGIHAGEIDGKDAGMMLFRDILHGEKKHLLDQATLLFIPILNVDGHERRSEYGRVNQRGPREMGWRSNAQNLNLNRDFTKLETAGVRAVVEVINAYDPDLYVDVHVTDGADYQYDITYGYVKTGGYSPAISAFLSDKIQPEVDQALSDWGHIPGPLLFAANGQDFSEGNVAFSFSPRFSHTYGDARHLPSILIENHSLKPFRQRVLGTYVFLEQAIKTIGEHYQEIRDAVAADQNQPKDELIVKFGFRESPADTMEFLGIASEKVKSDITGREFIQWKGEPIIQQVPSLLMDRPVQEVSTPEAYFVPAEWTVVIKKLRQHGLKMETLETSTELELEFDFLTEYQLSPNPLEGKIRFQSFETKQITRRVKLAPGSVKIPVDQNLGELASIFLEAESVDSFFQWGYFMSILSQTEYMETYIMEPMIQQLLKEDAALRAEFEQAKAANPDWVNSPRSIYRWFYERTPYFDQNWKVIPIGKLR